MSRRCGSATSSRTPHRRQACHDPRVPVRPLTSLRLRTLDLADRVLGRGDPRVPPRRLQARVGDSDFRATGEEFRRHFHELAGLSPADRVLDIGCGFGRMARVLASELEPPDGAYDGFDVTADAIEWCRAGYRHLAVPFRFAHVDLHHPLYSPSGSGKPEEFRFPYADGAFDLAIATSVFTHLLTDAAEHYLAQASRVLARGGRLFSTWLLVDEAGSAPRHRAAFQFTARVGAARVADTATPEAAVAYPLSWVRQTLARHGMRLREPPALGHWRGGEGRSFQDILVADRAEP